jgi:hypothetical protein
VAPAAPLNWASPVELLNRLNHFNDSTMPKASIQRCRRQQFNGIADANSTAYQSNKNRGNDNEQT